MFEKRVHQSCKLVTKNIKSNKSCNKFVVKQCILCVIHYTHVTLCSIIIQICYSY